ncbi:ImmA/IrrE family metallo-endopeptidase [Saccharothrix sp. HUAS TT1]|uniref:ImmA/IrrE family metallo-endopeptidase n=1 Tax=unclassified Saccharothrix TaxID=2593673 RepID=UPI00345C150C
MSRRTGQPFPAEDLSARAVADAFDPARLTQLRLLAGLTKQEVADVMRVSAAAVGQYEGAVTHPRPDHLEKLADHLGYPVAFFATGRPHVRLDASGVHFRSLRATRASQRARAVAHVEQLWELTHALEIRVELPKVDLPTSAAAPEVAAGELKRRWGLGPGPVRHLVRTMEAHGIVVSQCGAGEEGTAGVGTFGTSRLPRPIIVITADRTADVHDLRFAAAHELGHLVLHHEAAPGDAAQERGADRFAAELLMPAAELADELPTRPRVVVLDALGEFWGVPPAALVKRARELGVISEVSARRARQRLQEVGATGQRRTRSVDHYPGERSTLLRGAFELAEQHGLTRRDLARELVWPLSRLRGLLGVADDRPQLRLVVPAEPVAPAVAVEPAAGRLAPGRWLPVGDDGVPAHLRRQGAHVPAPLPSDLALPTSAHRLLALAEHALGRLDEAVRHLPDPAAFHELQRLRDVRAQWPAVGLAELLVERRSGSCSSLNTTMDAFRSAEEELMRGKEPDVDSLRRLGAAFTGDDRVRTGVGWLSAGGKQDAYLLTASGAPLLAALEQWATWVRAAPGLPRLAKVALAHAQLELLQPFPTANGQVARAFSVLELIRNGLVRGHVLPLSEWRHDVHHRRLRALVDGGPVHEWVESYVRDLRDLALAQIGLIDDLEGLRRDFQARLSPSPVVRRVIGALMTSPVFTARDLGEKFGLARRTAAQVLRALVQHDIVRRRGSGEVVYACDAALDVLSRSRGFPSHGPDS